MRGTMIDAEWIISDGLVDYEAATAFMEKRAADIAAKTAPETVWLLEHPPLYTTGTTAQETDLLDPRFPVYRSTRGGQYTYHGPGQRIVYLMLDLKARHLSVRRFVDRLEAWLIAALMQFNVRGERRDDRIGIWVPRGNGREDKIAALGIRVRRGVTFHGAAINVEPDLTHFSGIVPCGVREHGVTSLVDLGLPVSMADMDVALKATFPRIFGDRTPAREAQAVGR